MWTAILSTPPYCSKGGCWHVGNSAWAEESWEENEQARVREMQIADFREQESIRAAEIAHA
jgi:hypothetical protein